MSHDHPTSFPHLAYAHYVLEPQFIDAQRHLFPAMIAANEAHTLMLAECGIIPQDHATRLLRALADVKGNGPDAFAYAPRIEDLFFAVEGKLIEIAGADAGGDLQTARSRNDLGAAINRMALRGRILAAREQVLALREALLDLIEQHTETLMPGITHTQPAQPTTLAHYLLGVLGPLERDSDRLARAYERVNRSPLGVAAFTTSSFPVDRDLVANLLGFDGLVENGYDAVGTGDHLVEAAQTLVNSMGSLSRFVYELLVWARQTENYVRIDDSFIQISSIMPQKRNPVVLEHIRIRMGWVYGDASTVTTIIHNAAFGDTNDVEDPMFVPLNRAFDAAESVYNLMTAVLRSITFNVDLMEHRAGEGNSTATALADALVRDYRLPFRSAHTIVSRLVTRTMADTSTITAGLVNEISGDVLGAPLAVDDGFVSDALDPWAFVRARTIPGGPAPETTRQALESARRRLIRDIDALEADRARLDQADVERAKRIEVVSA
jgi:argininosuccinate lyase